MKFTGRVFAIQAILTVFLAVAGISSVAADAIPASASTGALPIRCHPRREYEECPAPVPRDGAIIVSNTIPLSMVAGRSYDVSITVLNTGRATWSRVARGPADGSRGYKLGAVGDRDRFYQGTRVWLPPGVEISPDDTYTFELTLVAPSEPGIYVTDWQMVHENVGWFGSTLVARIQVKAEHVAPTPTPGQRPSPTPAPTGRANPRNPIPDNDPFGVVAAPGLGNDPRRMNGIRDLGVGWVRVGYDWPIMQPNPGANNIDWVLARRIVDGLTSRGLKIYWDFSYAPGWSNGRGGNSDDDIDYPPDPQLLYDFVHAVVSRFKNDVDAWGTWNEPNLDQFYKGSPSHYIDVILPTIVRAINDADSNAYIVVGETSSSGDTHFIWLRDMLRSVRGQFDAISHHVYDGDDRCSGRVEAMDSLHRRLRSWGFGSYPVWITETGLSESEVSKSVYLTCFWRAMLERDWWSKTFWYRYEPDANWGLVDTAGYPNRTYQTYQNFISSRVVGSSQSLQAETGSQPSVPVLTGGSQSSSAELIAGGGGTVWEHDDFEGLLMGPLNGQNDWYSTGPSPQVVLQPGRGQVLMIDPYGTSSVSARKNVPAQSSGLQSLAFDVRVTGASEASLAKLELKTSPSGGWDRKFQVYFGSSMRVNYGRTGAAVTIVPQTQMGRWYHIRLEMNMNTGGLNVFVDGSLAASNLPMHPGPIAGLSLTGWNRSGAVYLDNLLGVARNSSLSVRIASPGGGATVSGVTSVIADASSSATGVEFYVDGALQHTDTSPPFTYSWNTARNPLPAPNHSIDLGYYFVEWKNPSQFDAARAEVSDYTNLYYASRSSYISDLTPAEWKPLMAQSLANARAEGNKIHLAMDSETIWDHVLDVAAPFWADVVRIEIEDEPSLSRGQTQAMIRRLETRLAARGMSRKPMGFVYVYTVPLPDAVNAAGLDWVGIEAYLNYPGSSDSPQNVAAMNSHLENNMARVPAGKDIVLVMMAYDRNGNWRNIDTLRDLQTPIYLHAYNDPRVISINMFSYTRAGGTRDHPELTTAHKMIGEHALGSAIPGAGNGLRTLTVRAFDVLGNDATDRAVVTVSNPGTGPTATPTALTPTSTPTVTATAPTPTSTSTASPLPSATLTPSPGPTATPGGPTWTPTPGPSTTPVTPSATPSPTPIATSTPSPIPSATPSPTRTVPTRTPSPTPIPPAWEQDSFDNLSTGSLNGQNGWRAGQASPRVIASGSGKLLEIDPGAGRTISIGKNVPDQIAGRQRFEFDVRVTGASEPSLAKIEVQTASSGGWDKKFQVYFGSSMRVNYSKSGGAVTIVSATEMDRWYHIICEIDLAGNQLHVWVDGRVVASGISMHPGPIRSLGISGWDRDGSVQLDNLLGRGW